MKWGIKRQSADTSECILKGNNTVIMIKGSEKPDNFLVITLSIFLITETFFCSCFIFLWGEENDFQVLKITKKM